MEKYLQGETILAGDITLCDIARINEAIDIKIENEARINRYLSKK